MDPGVIAILISWISITAVVFGHVYRQLLNIRAQMEDIAAAHAKEMWTKMNQIETDMGIDRRQQAEFRERMLERMISKTDFDREISRLINEIDRRFAAAIRHRPPIAGQD
jgi:hypothetical protein